MRQIELTAEIEAQAEQSYNQLEGKWLEWLEVAKRFEHKAKAQDRLDLRHNIIVAFADQQARNERLGKPDLSLPDSIVSFIAPKLDTNLLHNVLGRGERPSYPLR